MLEPLRQAGGRAYALAAFAIVAVAVLEALYMGLLIYAVVWKAQPITPELLSPLIFGIVVIGGLGGASTLPNIAERWGGAQPPPGA